MFFVALAGCWSEQLQFDQVVWADDDSQKLMVDLLFQERGAIGDTSNKRNFRHQLVLDGADLGDVREGQNGAEVYLMLQGGYAVSSVLDAEARLSFSYTDLDSGVVTALEPFSSEDSGYYVPSPDAAWLARVASNGTNVTIFDASTLFEIATASLSPDFGVDWTWTPTGVFVVTDGVSAWSVTPSGQVEPASVPRCTHPKTTSSPISASGVFVYTDAQGVREEEQDPATAFGCQ